MERGRFGTFARVVVTGVLVAGGALVAPPAAHANDSHRIDIRATQVGQDVVFEWDPVPPSAWPAPQAGGPWTSLTYWAAATPMDSTPPRVYHYCDGATRLLGEIPPPPQSSTTCRMSGLEPGRAYDFRVSGWLSNDALHTNSVGAGDLYAEGGFTVCCGAPGAPSDVRLIDIGNGDLMVVWSPVSDTGGATTVEYRVALDTDVDACVTSTTECQFRSVEFGRQYVATVTSVTAFGQSIEQTSPPVRLVPPPPRAPRNVRATRQGQSAVVRWQRPRLASGQSIRRYQVFADPGNRTCRTVTTRCRISNLDPGRSYTFEVVATDDQGRRVASTSKNSILVPRPTPVVTRPAQDATEPAEPEAPKPEQQFN